MRMDLVRDLLATLRMEPEDIADSGVSPSPLDRLDRLSTDEIRELGRVAAPKLVNRWGTPLGTMLPGLLHWQSEPVLPASLMTRSYNALVREGAATWGDVAKLTPGQLFKFRSVGWLTVIDIVAASVEQSLRPYQAGDADEDDGAEDSDADLREPLQHFDTDSRLFGSTGAGGNHDLGWRH